LAPASLRSRRDFLPSPTILAWEHELKIRTLTLEGTVGTMGEDLEHLKQRIPLLTYLQRHHWSGRPAAVRSEFVGLCPLHEDTRPSFYVNPRKNLFYCHGCGQGWGWR